MLLMAWLLRRSVRGITEDATASVCEWKFETTMLLQPQARSQILDSWRVKLLDFFEKILETKYHLRLKSEKPWIKRSDLGFEDKFSLKINEQLKI